MTREEQIHYAYLNYCDWQNGDEYSEEQLWEAAVGWADEHQKSPWKKAAEELPKLGDVCVVMVDGRNPRVCRYTGAEQFVNMMNAEIVYRPRMITDWMLIKLPK